MHHATISYMLRIVLLPLLLVWVSDQEGVAATRSGEPLSNSDAVPSTHHAATLPIADPLALLTRPAVVMYQVDCPDGACITIGPRILSVSTEEAGLLSLVLGNLLQTNIDVLDWQAIAAGTINLNAFFTQLQADLGVSSTQEVLEENVTLSQILQAASTVASNNGDSNLSAALLALESEIVATVTGTVMLGNLFDIDLADGNLATITINALELVRGVVELYNNENVLTTAPEFITLDSNTLTVLGLGGLADEVQLAFQVVEPPTYTCGGVGTTARSAAIRLKLDLDLDAIPLMVGIASGSITDLEVYLEVAQAVAEITALNAVAGTVTISNQPGIADVYIGQLADDTFFDRSLTRAGLEAALEYGTIGTLNVLGTGVVDIEVRGEGSLASSPTLDTFSGPYPETRTYGNSLTAVTALLADLSTDLELRTTLDDLVVDTGLSIGPVVFPLLTGLLNDILLAGDVLLDLLGIGIGEMDTTVHGVIDTQECGSIAGTVFQDLDMDGVYEPGDGEIGLDDVPVALTQPGPDDTCGTGDDVALASTTTDEDGSYSFEGLPPGSYCINPNEDVLLGNQTATTDDPVRVELGVSENATANIGYAPSPDGCTGTFDCSVPFSISSTSPSRSCTGDIGFTNVVDNGDNTYTYTVGVANVTCTGPGNSTQVLSVVYELPSGSTATTTFSDFGSGCRQFTFTTNGTYEEDELVSFTVTITGGAQQTVEVSASSCGPQFVPVELTSFAALVDGEVVVLRWATASETNNAGFEVQQAGATGEEDWQMLGFVEGYGTTVVPKTYSFRIDSLMPGAHRFRLRQVDYDGTFEYSPEVEVYVGMAHTYLIERAYPNPFNPVTTLRFSVRQAQEVVVNLFDVQGRLVQNLSKGEVSPGVMNVVRIDGSALASGVYFVRVVGERFAETQPITLLK